MSDNIVVVDNGQTYETSESAIVAKNEADRAEQWAKYSEEKANLADERAIDAAESSDAAAQAETAAIAAKEYAENAITDNNLITVATDLKATPSNIKTVAGSIANVNTVGENIDIINSVAGNATNINAVNANKANIDIVANNIDSVNDVAMIKDDVVNVSENISDVMTVADNIADVSNVSSNITDVKAAVYSAESALASKNSAAQSETNAQIWAEGEDRDVDGLGGTHSAKKWAELAGSLVNVQPASETTSGIVRLSTTAEAKEGFDDSTAITPLKLAQVVADNVGRGIQLGFNGTLTGNLLTFETTDPSPYTLRHNYDYEIDLLFEAVGELADDVEIVIKNGSDYINIVNVLHDDYTNHITVGDLKQIMKYSTDIGWRWIFMARYTITATGDKVLVMPSTVVNVGGGGLEIGDIGFAPLGIDETQNKRRYLNGQVISQTQFATFSDKVKAAVALYPSLSATEENWQAEVTNSKLGQCGKFVIDDAAGTIRLPKVVNINGLTDLSLMGGIKAESLPNITGTFRGRNAYNGNASTNESVVTGAFGIRNESGTKTGAQAGGTNSFTWTFDASRSSSTYQDNAPVQQEAVQYPYFIQVATGSEESVDVSTEIQLNNPFSLLDYKWSEYELSNASWLISNGSFHSGATYPAVYNLLLAVYNGTETKDGVSVKLSTEAYTDTDFVINTADTTFRLPIKVKLASGNAVAGNGMTLGLQGINHQNIEPMANSWKISTTGWVGVSTGLSDGEKIIITTDPTKSGIETSSQGLYLYFYVGETIQDANVINAAGVLTRVADLSNSYISGLGMPSNRYIDLTLGASGSTYTAPANGYIVFAKTSTAANQWLSLGVPENGLQAQSISISGGQGLGCFIPIGKGQTAEVNYQVGGETTVFRFIYAEGDK